MKKMLLILMLSNLFVSGLWSRNIVDCFNDMPASLLPGLTPNMRLDLVDFFNSGKSAKMLSLLGEEVELKSLTDNYLMLQTSSAGSLQIKSLPLSGGSLVLAVVHTVKAPAASSDLSYYSLEWQAIDSLSKPTVQVLDFVDSDCLQIKSLTQDLSAAEISSLYFYEFVFQGGNNALIIYSSVPDFLGEEAFKEFRDCFNQRVVYHWTGSGYVKP